MREANENRDAGSAIFGLLSSAAVLSKRQEPLHRHPVVHLLVPQPNECVRPMRTPALKIRCIRQNNLPWKCSKSRKLQCSLSLGGFGSLPGWIVSLLRILPSTALVVSSPPPDFFSIPFAACSASRCVRCTLPARFASLRLFSQVLSGRRDDVTNCHILSPKIDEVHMDFSLQISICQLWL